MAEHIAPKKLYFLIFLILGILTGVTTAVAYVDLGHPWNTVVALIIAGCKASLVGLFFMHLRWSSPLMRLVCVAALFWLAILITLTLSDEFTRDWTLKPQGWETSSAVPQGPTTTTPR